MTNKEYIEGQVDELTSALRAQVLDEVEMIFEPEDPRWPPVRRRLLRILSDQRGYTQRIKEIVGRITQ